MKWRKQKAWLSGILISLVFALLIGCGKPVLLTTTERSFLGTWEKVNESGEVSQWTFSKDRSFNGAPDVSWRVTGSTLVLYFDKFFDEETQEWLQGFEICYQFEFSEDDGRIELQVKKPNGQLGKRSTLRRP